MKDVKPVEIFFSSKSPLPNTPFSLISQHHRKFGNCSSNYNVASYKEVVADESDSTLIVQNKINTIDVYN